MRWPISLVDWLHGYSYLKNFLGMISSPFLYFRDLLIPRIARLNTFGVRGHQEHSMLVFKLNLAKGGSKNSRIELNSFWITITNYSVGVFNLNSTWKHHVEKLK
eukprot:TRINITY_DN6976_c0_g3_i2.p1 TRINITY_DN6976_c0_g3~~TRINITY_DN6976_c0_g3_i2.p1  ORF type:complete len:104 (+),score=29.42 TRINITY_DN6976_c0_g3_i2:164-475(+)